VTAGSAKFELTGPNSEPLFSGMLVVRKATASSVDYSVEK